MRHLLSFVLVLLLLQSTVAYSHRTSTQYIDFVAQRQRSKALVGSKIELNVSPHGHIGYGISCRNAQTRVDAAVGLKGGSIPNSSFQKLPHLLNLSPDHLFNCIFVGLTALAGSWKVLEYYTKDTTKGVVNDMDETPVGVKTLQRKFLSVFWLLRMADWLQGPYFYEVYASKVLNGQKVSMDMVSKLFLVGFASTGLFGPWIGRFVDVCGRKLGILVTFIFIHSLIRSLIMFFSHCPGTILFTVLYSLSALSTRSNALSVLMLGRLAGGLGTSLLFSSPEAWLVSEQQKQVLFADNVEYTYAMTAYACGHVVVTIILTIASINTEIVFISFDIIFHMHHLNIMQGIDGKWLGQTFGWAYAGDAIVAISAGQLASMIAAKQGPTGPFTLSLGFLAAGALLALTQWAENVASKSDNDGKKVGIGDALGKIFGDRRVLLIGAVQALFEGAMYIFVLQWPPAIREVGFYDYSKS